MKNPMKKHHQDLACKSRVSNLPAVRAALAERDTAYAEAVHRTAVSSQLGRDQCLAAKSLDILINPQFGELNYSDFSVVAAPSTLSATQTSKSAAKVTRNPPC